MRKLAQFLCLLLALSTSSGCESMTDYLVKESISAASGETKQERHDREQMEVYRQQSAAKAKTLWEIEPNAQNSFRKEFGRDPNINWHAR